MVHFSVGGKNKTASLARLVWKAFSAIEIGKGQIVCFSDGNRENRRFDNLYIGRRAFTRHCRDQLPRGEDHNTAKLTESAVRHIRATTAEQGYKRSVYTQLGEKYGVNPRTVSDAAKGKTWKWFEMTGLWT